MRMAGRAASPRARGAAGPPRAPAARRGPPWRARASSSRPCAQTPPSGRCRGASAPRRTPGWRRGTPATTPAAPPPCAATGCRCLRVSQSGQWDGGCLCLRAGRRGRSDGGCRCLRVSQSGLSDGGRQTDAWRAVALAGTCCPASRCCSRVGGSRSRGPPPGARGTHPRRQTRRAAPGRTWRPRTWPRRSRACRARPASSARRPARSPACRRARRRCLPRHRSERPRPAWVARCAAGAPWPSQGAAPVASRARPGRCLSPPSNHAGNLHKRMGACHDAAPGCAPGAPPTCALHEQAAAPLQDKQLGMWPQGGPAHCLRGASSCAAAAPWASITRSSSLAPSAVRAATGMTTCSPRRRRRHAPALQGLAATDGRGRSGVCAGARHCAPAHRRGHTRQPARQRQGVTKAPLPPGQARRRRGARAAHRRVQRGGRGRVRGRRHGAGRRRRGVQYLRGARAPGHQAVHVGAAKAEVGNGHRAALPRRRLRDDLRQRAVVSCCTHPSACSWPRTPARPGRPRSFCGRCLRACIRTARSGAGVCGMAALTAGSRRVHADAAVLQRCRPPIAQGDPNPCCPTLP
jgi:hypothetical protein